MEMKIRESCLQSGTFIYKPGISVTKQDFHLQMGSLGLQMGFSGYYLPGDIRAIAVEDFLTDYAVKDPALLVARAENLQTALNHLEERLAEWYHLTDAQQKTILLSFAAERKKYLENVVQY